MLNAILQAPNGKWFFKLYDEAGSAVFNSGVVFDSQMDAFNACQEKMGGVSEVEKESSEEEDGVEEAPKKTRGRPKAS